MTKKFSQMGRIANPKELRYEEALLQVCVTSDAYGKSLTLADPKSGIALGVDADLIAFWLEHGTE